MGDAPLAILYDEGENPTEPLMAKIAEGKRKEAIQFLKELHNEVMGEGSSIIPLSKMKLKSCTMMTRERPASTSPLPDWLSAFPVSDCSGLSLYDIRQRYREIALRKVNGATGKQIALLLVRKYLSILGAAFVVAISLVYYIINDYTKDFAVKAR